MNIAVFGGSFDPPHRGHKKVIEEALKVLDIDKLFVIPTYLNPFKKEFFFDENLRYDMIYKMVKDLDKVEVLDLEIKQKRAVTTYETVQALKKNYNPDHIYLIIGADNLKKLNKWYNFKELEKIVEFVVATRDDIKIPKSYKKLHVNENISSTQIRREKIE